VTITSAPHDTRHDRVTTPDARRDLTHYGAAVRAFRPRRGLPAVLAGVVIAAVTVLAVLNIVAAHADPSAEFPSVSSMKHFGVTTRWDDPAVLAIGAGACGLGLVLILLAAWPGRSRIVPIGSPDEHTLTGITRRGLRRYLADAATVVEGIDDARVHVSRSRARIVADSSLRDARGLHSQVRDAVAAGHDGLAPLAPLQLRVTIRKRRD
jgi:Family of unknown function (DUF6286)